MSGAEELLNSGASTYLARPESEPHIVIGEDRFITVPAELKRIAVQFDHDIETVTFDCPRYWDGLDMSKMSIYINYMRSDRAYGCFRAENVTIDEADENIMHFTWTISKNVTLVKGNLQFLVCVRNSDDEDNEINHWNSELCTDMYVSEGMECAEVILPEYPDIISQWDSEVNAIIDKYESSVEATINQCKDDTQATIDILLNLRDTGAFNGATFVPSITPDGILSWTNNGGFKNPTTMNIRGAAGINAVVVSELEPATGPVLWFDTSAKGVE